MMNWFQGNVDNTQEEIGKAHWKAMEYLLSEANKKVPHDEGTLERSGIVTQGGLSGRPQQVYNKAKANQEPKNMFKFDFSKPMKFFLSYNTPYAVKLHENPQYNFREGREGKWLEKATKQKSKKISQWLKKELR